MDQSLAQGDAKWEIDLEDRDSDTANGGQPTKNGTVPAEMATPFVAARIEESHDLSGYRINTRNVRPLVVVARKTA